MYRKERVALGKLYQCIYMYDFPTGTALWERIFSPKIHQTFWISSRNEYS
jgi:hypothetical protein